MAKSRTITLRLPAEVIDQLNQIAKLNGTTTHNLIKTIVCHYIDSGNLEQIVELRPSSGTIYSRTEYRNHLISIREGKTTAIKRMIDSGVDPNGVASEMGVSLATVYRYRRFIRGVR
jgi:hypothetical protein